MADLRGFNANNVEPMDQFEPLPAGRYLAMIVESEMKPTKDQRGEYLQLKFQVLEGQFKGRFLWARLNLKNANETATKIARAELAAICRAVGVVTPNDSCDLHNLPLLLKVRCRKNKDSDEISNQLSGYERREAAGGQPPQAQSSTPPWRRN